VFELKEVEEEIEKTSKKEFLTSNDKKDVELLKDVALMLNLC
jgi:hypothetical protein